MNKIFNKKLLGFVVSIVFIVLIIKSIDIKESIEAVKQLNPAYLLFMVPAYFCAFIFRAFRWRAILTHDKKIKIMSLLNSLFKGWLVNCVVPARGGEFFRAHHFGKREDISRVKVLASIVLERIFDGMVLFLILLFLISFIYSNQNMGKIATAAGIVFVGGFIGLLITAKLHKNKTFKEKFSAFTASFAKIGFINKIFNKADYFIENFMDGLEVFHSPLLLTKVFLLSMCVWAFEAISAWLLIIGFGHYIGISGALFVLSIAAFASLIPAGPAGIGPVQWGYIISLGVFNVSKETAFAISILGTLFSIIFVFAASIIFSFLEKNTETKETP